MHDLKVYEMHGHKGIAKVFMHMFYGGISYQTHGLKVFSQMHGLKGIVKCSCKCFMKAFHVKHVALKVLVKCSCTCFWQTFPIHGLQGLAKCSCRCFMGIGVFFCMCEECNRSSSHQNVLKLLYFLKCYE